MQILECDKGYGGSINFIDTNDVFIGYDLSQDCCEYADWYISESLEFVYPIDKIKRMDKSLYEHHVFNPSFIEGPNESSDLDAGMWVAFKMVDNGKPDLFLILFNSHNGYYGHGFELKIDGEIIHNGGL